MKHADCSQFEVCTVCTGPCADMREDISVRRADVIVLCGTTCLSAKEQSKVV